MGRYLLELLVLALVAGTLISTAAGVTMLTFWLFGYTAAFITLVTFWSITAVGFTLLMVADS